MTTSNKQAKLAITDPSVIAFYQQHPQLSVNLVNRVVVEMLTKLSTNLEETIQDSMLHKILDTVTELHSDTKQARQEATIQTLNLLNKLHEQRQELAGEVRGILENQQLSSAEKLQRIVETNNELMVSKTSMMVADILPKHQDKYHTQVQQALALLQTSLVDAFRSDHTDLSKYMQTMDNQVNAMLRNIQQPILHYIQSSEERTQAQIQKLGGSVAAQQTTQETLSTELHAFLNKYKYNSSVKGNVSETELYFVLQQIFPSDEIVDCSTETAACDYRVNRLHAHKPTILFENKDYERTVSTDEISKFERDVHLQQKHGIFLSQKSNITYKEPFQIDIVDNLIHVYIPNAQYSVEKIKMAVDIIDSLSTRLATVDRSADGSFHLSKEDLDGLLETYTDFVRQKTQLMDTVRANSKAMLDQLEAFHLHAVRKVLVQHGLCQPLEDFKCKFCDTFVGKNKASLGAHIRSCRANPNRVAGGGM